jgi:hypothetical protein
MLAGYITCIVAYSHLNTEPLSIPQNFCDNFPPPPRNFYDASCVIPPPPRMDAPADGNGVGWFLLFLSVSFAMFDWLTSSTSRILCGKYERIVQCLSSDRLRQRKTLGL